MARPIKEGLSYFPLDVDSDYDDKFQLIEGLHGPTGFATILKIYMKIYSSGYYYRWEDKEKILMAKRIGIDSNTLNNIISDCVKYELFNEKLFTIHNILTSEGIQKRFFTAVGKRKVGVLIEEFLLMDTEEVLELCPKMTIKRVIPKKTIVNHGITPVIQESSTQSKVKETKVNKTKVEEENSDVNVHRFYQENFGIETPFITEDIEYWINDLSKEVVTLALQKAIEKNAEYAYAKGILKQWAKKGIKTLDAANAESLSKARKGSYSNNTKTETLPEWVDNQEEDEEVSPEEEASFQKRLKEIRAMKGVSK